MILYETQITELQIYSHRGVFHEGQHLTAIHKIQLIKFAVMAILLLPCWLPIACLLPRAIQIVGLYIFEVLQSLASIITEKLHLFFTAEIEMSPCIHLHIFKFEKHGRLTVLNML